MSLAYAEVKRFLHILSLTVRKHMPRKKSSNLNFSSTKANFSPWKILFLCLLHSLSMESICFTTVLKEKYKLLEYSHKIPS